MGIKARLGRNFVGLNRTRFDFKVTFMMSSYDGLDIDNATLFIRCLNDRGEYSCTDSGRRIIVVVITDYATARFSSTNVEAVGTTLRL